MTVEEDAAPPPVMAGDEAPAHRHAGAALLVIATAQLMVVLDASIVNIALPSMQRALHFSSANLEWVINAYTLAFGGLLLLGGRTGDLFGRRRMFMIGITIFSLASLLGGFATSQAWLIAARAVQGVGGAITAPTALSLIASTFAEGRERNRAMGVYAAMSGAGGAIGVLLGGVLTNALSWRWVLFVNVPIGLFVVLLAPRVLGETQTSRGRLDLPGALSATAGMSLVVYGLIHAGSAAWGDLGTIVPLVAGAVLLAVFLIVEIRAPHALLPLHIFRNRNRSGAYAIMLAIGTAMFSMFFFLTLFLQNVLGFSPLRAGVSYLPFALTIMVVAGITSQLVGRIGPRPLLMVGPLLAAGGLLLFSRLTVTSSYWPNVFPGMVLAAGGMAMSFVPLTLAAVSNVRRDEAGIASALLNTGQQVGGSLGLAVLGTISATAFRGQLTGLLSRLANPVVVHALSAGAPVSAFHLPPPAVGAVNHALTHGYTTAFSVGAGIMLAAFLIALLVVRVAVPVGAPAEAVAV
ncbi:MAG TPA: MFS transporter [Acidimicrobiales bacterium]|nr:MFS transporter [Acidimicrobiales bacterium]